MTKKVHTYASDDLVVEYDVARCIHVKECVKGLPTVFDPDLIRSAAPGSIPVSHRRRRSRM